MINSNPLKSKPTKLMTEKEGARCSRLALTKRIMHLEAALQRIEAWEVPYEGYSWHWGSLGQDVYIQSIAKHGLYNTPVKYNPKPDVVENLKTFGFNKAVATAVG